MVWARATSSIRCPSAGEAVKPEVDGVSGLGRLADLAQLLEAASPRSLPGTRIDDEDGAFAVVDLDAFRRDHAQQRVVDQMGQLVAAHYQLAVVDQQRKPVAASAQDVLEQNRPLPEVAHIVVDSARRQFAGLDRYFVELIQSGQRQSIDLARKLEQARLRRSFHRFLAQGGSAGTRRRHAPAPGSEIGKTRGEVPYLEPDAEGWRKHRETINVHLPF
jgi:hypothetical protein